MRKILIFIANILIIGFIMIFVSLHVTNQGNLHISRNRENFINMTISLERVTTYYLEGEQRLCNSWARYISQNNLTMYTPLSKSNPIYLDELGLVDNATAQMRNAVYKVLRGNMTVDEAVANYGSF